jgi:AraC-like DNA-binding protein
MSTLKHHDFAITWQVKKSYQNTQRINSIDAGSFGFYHVVGTENQVTLLNQASNANPCSCIMFTIGGTNKLSINKSTKPLVIGDVLVWHSTEAISIQCDSSFQILLILLPTILLKKKWTGLIPLERCSKLSQHNSLTSLGRGLLENLWQQHMYLSKEELDAGINSVLDLLNNAQRLTCITEPDSKDIFPKMSEYIDRELRDTSLSPQKIAETFGCSLRSTHLIFSKHSKTISSEIRNRRLERARLILIRHANALSISAIAFKFGFTDPGHFSRLFKARYGSTPREYRDSNS